MTTIYLWIACAAIAAFVGPVYSKNHWLEWIIGYIVSFVICLVAWPLVLIALIINETRK